MTPVLLLVDAQKNMLLPPAPVPDAGTVGPLIEDLLKRARAAGAPVVHIRNSGGPDDPDLPGTPGWELVHDVTDSESIVDKHRSDAFLGTDLADHLPADAHVVLVGMQSEYCIRATALSALQRRLPVTLVRGAHATYSDGEPAADISVRTEVELAEAGVTIADPADVTFQRD